MAALCGGHEACVLALPDMPRRQTWTAVLFSIVCASCSDAVPASSACRNLVYKEGGLSRAEYLPCADEMMAALDDLSVQTKAASSGDRQARSNGRAALARLTGLMNAAGGRNLLERWSDRPLTELNLDISNAVTSYTAFYMVRVLEEPHPYAAQSRRAADSEFGKATQSYADARAVYRRLR
jgi:hypothetical protein